MTNPRQTTNPPGLPAITFGPGNHRLVYDELCAAIRRAPAIRALAAQTPASDPTMALVDCWAMMADIVGFYQERLANEAYVRTAVQFRSLVEITNQIGYGISTGVAASTPLAFFLASTAPDDFAQLPTGIQVQSIPGNGEQPQTFETVEDIEARADWNVLRAPSPVSNRILTPIDWNMKALTLDGDQSQIQAGDAMLLPESSTENTVRIVLVERVDVSSAADATTVRWAEDLYSGPVSGALPREMPVLHFRDRAQVFGYNAPDWKAMPPEIKKAYEARGEDAKEWPHFGLKGEGSIDLDRVVAAQLSEGWLMMIDQENRAQPWLAEIASASIVSQTNFTMTAQVTRLVGKVSQSLAQFGRRSSVVYCNTVPVSLATMAREIILPVRGPRIDLERPAIGLRRGQKLIFSGKPVHIVLQKSEDLRTLDGCLVHVTKGSSLRLDRIPFPSEPDVYAANLSLIWPVTADDGTRGTIEASEADVVFAAAPGADPEVAELAIIDVPPSAAQSRQLILNAALDRWYDPVSLKIHANVADATHGARVTDILGGGQASVPSQRFRLNYQPLTYVAAPTSSGRCSSLSLRVDGVVWTEVETLHSQPANAAVYSIVTDVHGDSWVLFGDGDRGRRLPSGYDNVVASYRYGTGALGNVGEGRLTMLLDAPAGVEDVVNPLPARGGSPLPDVQSTAHVAPTKTEALDRIVTLKDYSDFAEGFGGIAKARAVPYSTPVGAGVMLTIAAGDGQPIERTSMVFRYLVDAIARLADPSHHVEIANARKVEMGLTATVWVDHERNSEAVLAAVQSRLTARYGFEARRLDQPITTAEVLADVMDVPGVNLADIDLLSPLQQQRADTKLPAPATLTVINPEAILLKERLW